MKHNLSLFKKRSKSKTPEPAGHGGPNPQVVDTVQPSTLYTTYQIPPQPYHPHQTLYQPQQHQQQQQLIHQAPPIQIHPQLSPCPYQTCQQPQQHMIQPNPQSSTACLQFRNGTLEPVRTMDNNGMVMNSQVQLALANVATMPAQYQGNQMQTTISSQSPQCPDNPYYSNQVGLVLQLQHQHHQQQQEHHQHQQHHQQHQNQHHQQNQHHLQQQQQIHNVHQQQQHHHQPQYQNHRQSQQAQQFSDQRHKQLCEQHQHIKTSPYQNHQQHLHQTQQQPQFEVVNQINDPQHQQQYQNHQVVKELANRDGDFSLEVLCIMHEKSKENLTKLADVLREDLKKLSGELEVIKKKTPEYSVNEVKI